MWFMAPSGFCWHTAMIRCYAPLTLLLAICSGCWGSAQTPVSNLPTATKTLSDALANARIENKPVLIVFTQDEFWCHRLEGYHADEEVARLLDEHFVLIRIWVDATPGGEQLYYEHGSDRGVPAYTIVDPNGERLADSGDVGQNVGFPNTAEEVKRYLEILKTACPEMTEDELSLLHSKLEARRVADVTTN
jgi:hypothetical protein